MAWSPGTDCSDIPEDAIVGPGEYLTPNNTECTNPGATQACYNNSIRGGGFSKRALCLCANACNTIPNTVTTTGQTSIGSPTKTASAGIVVGVMVGVVVLLVLILLAYWFLKRSGSASSSR